MSLEHAFWIIFLQASKHYKYSVSTLKLCSCKVWNVFLMHAFKKQCPKNQIAE